VTDERNCGTCQHWDRDSVREFDAGLCRAISVAVGTPWLHSDDDAARLATPSSFSCSLWEAKP